MNNLHYASMKTKTRRLLQSVWNIFDTCLILKSISGIILCISGGSDSRALMESIACWPNRFLKIHVVSVDHGTRTQTCQDADDVCNRARVLGFDTAVLKMKNTKNKNEAILRTERYRLIWEYAKKHNIDTLVTAHTLDDQAESFIMNIVGFGGGAEGGAMPDVALHQSLGSIVRPFLNFSRSYLISILTCMHINDYVKDPTNEYGNGKRVLVRKFLRLHRLPKERFAEISKRRSLELEALSFAGSKLISKKRELISIKLPIDIPEAIKFHALKDSIRHAIPKEDLRNMRSILNKIAKLHNCSVYIVPE